MEFKIDTKEHYTLIAVGNTSAESLITDKLAEKVVELGQNGSKNYIVDLQEVVSLDADAAEGLLNLHEMVYSNGQSLVFTGISAPVMVVLKNAGADTTINVAPTMVEAIDIINMEILERDLLAEE